MYIYIHDVGRSELSPSIFCFAHMTIVVSSTEVPVLRPELGVTERRPEALPMNWSFADGAAVSVASPSMALSPPASFLNHDRR